MNLKGLSTVSNTPVTAMLSVRINQEDLVALRGSAARAAVRRLRVGVTNLDLRALQPYVEQCVKLGISSGAFATRGRLVWQTTDANAPRLLFKGGLSVTNLLTVDQAASEAFVKWNALDVEGIDFTMQPERLQIDTVRLDGLKGSLLIGPDKQPNLAAILPRATNAAPNAAAPEPVDLAARKSPIPCPVGLGTLTWSNAAFRFVDASISHIASLASWLSGTIKGAFRPTRPRRPCWSSRAALMSCRLSPSPAR
jgi:hypothetical protein